MPYLKNGRGNWRIKRSARKIAGVDVPAFDVVAGDNVTEDEASDIETMLDDLGKLGKKGGSLLKDIATAKRVAIDVLHLWKKQEVKDIPTILSEDKLFPAIEKYLANPKKKNGEPLADITIAPYRSGLYSLVALNPDATLADLPELVIKFREQCMANKTPWRFKNVRLMAQAFARQQEGKYSDLWKSISVIETLETNDSSINKAIPVYEAFELLAKLPTAPMVTICYTMMLTGMHPMEYVGEWKVLADRIHIHGTKNQFRDRQVPLLVDPEHIERMQLAYPVTGLGTLVNPKGKKNTYTRSPVLNEALREASGKKTTMEMFRHCYRYWMGEAGIPESRAERYMGHSGGSDKGKTTYTQAQWDEHMEEDANTMAAYIDRNRQRPKKIQKIVKRLGAAV